MDSIRSMNILSPVIAAAERNHPPQEGDYFDDEGFLVCGKCHTRKQCEVRTPAGLFGPKAGTRKFPTLCACRQAEIEQEKRERQAQEEMRLVQDLKRNSLMDNAFREATFESYRVDKDNARNFKLCKRYAEHFDEMLEKNMGLLFYGDVGTGKSFSAACIANHLLDRRISVVMTSFIKLLDAMQNFGNDNDAMIRKMNRAKLLIIDDLGAERATDFALENVYHVIDSRVRESKPLIITTNLTLEEIRSPRDMKLSRIYDRLNGLYPMEFTGLSYRKYDAAARLKEMEAILEGDD